MPRTTTLLAAVMLIAPFASAQKGDLQATLKKLDAASATFKSAEADTKRESVNKVVGVPETQVGKIYLIGKGANLQVGIRIDGAGARVAEYKNGVLRDFIPARGCYNTVQASANKGKFESFLSLSFGTSGKELAAAWEITDLGPEMVDGVKTEKLALVAKDPGVRANYKNITVWMDLDRDVSLKQLSVASTGDTDTAYYSNIRLNQAKVNTKPFEFKGNACK